MTVRILNPLDWSVVKPGDWLQLNGDHTRVLKVELNCEAPTRVDLVHHDEHGEERRTFLAMIQGLDKVEVVADAAASLDFTTEGEVWYCTNDNVATAAVVPEEASFTKLLQRKTRNDQLELMLRLQQEGYNRLMAQQEAERLDLERQLAEAQENGEVSAGATAGTAGTEQSKTPASPAPEGEGADASATPSAGDVSA